MEQSNMICIRTFSAEMPAEMARMALAAGGVEAFVFRDDCGGMRPHLQPMTSVRLMVRGAESKTAEDILQAMEKLDHGKE